MGFFSSRKAESNYVVHDKSVAQVIRSRFYGKYKGKGHQPEPDHNFQAPVPPLDQPLEKRPDDHNPISPPPKLPSSGLPRTSTDVLTMTLAQRLNELSAANSEGLLNDDEYRLLRQNLFERFANSAAVPIETPMVRLNPTHVQGHGRRASSQSRSATTSYSSRAPSIQSKQSVTSSVGSILRRVTSRSSSKAVDSTDTTSLFSQTSRSSRIFRPRIFAGLLSRNGSTPSLRTENSPSPHNDTQSIASRRTDTASVKNASQGPKSDSSLLRSATRRARRLASTTPPSSFPSASAPPAPLEPRRSLLLESSNGLFEESHLNTVKDIREEIKLVQAEGRRLLDAFDGLELSTLTRRHRDVPTISASLYGDRHGDGPWSEGVESRWTLVPDKKTLLLGKDSDTSSMHSNRSMGTTLSGSKSSRGRPLHGSASAAQPLTRMNSFSSSSSRGNHKVGAGSFTSNASGSNVVLNLTRNNGQLPLAPVDERFARGLSSSATDCEDHDSARSWREVEGMEDYEIGCTSQGGKHEGRSRGTERDANATLLALEKELHDIRGRRAEVTARYEARLEYLQAKLKGAEIREKVLRY